LPSSATLSTASEIIILVIESLDGFDSYYATPALIEAEWRAYDISTFFSNLSDNFILLCLFELALSFLRAFSNDGIYIKIIRYSNFVAVAILFALAIAAEGTNEAYITETEYGYNLDVSVTNVNNLFGAYYIIYWIISLPVAILSTFVLYCSIQKKYLQSVSKARYLVSVLPAFHLSTSPFSLLQIYPSKVYYLLVACPSSSPATSSLPLSLTSSAQHGTYTTQSSIISTLTLKFTSRSTS